MEHRVRDVDLQGGVDDGKGRPGQFLKIEADGSSGINLGWYIVGRSAKRQRRTPDIERPGTDRAPIKSEVLGKTGVDFDNAGFDEHLGRDLVKALNDFFDAFDDRRHIRDDDHVQPVVDTGFAAHLVHASFAGG